MPEVTSFHDSFVRWSIPPNPDDTRQPGHMPWGNSVRIQIDARCTITDEQLGTSTELFLIAPCRKEWMYRDTELIMTPGGEYRMIFSRDRQANVAMHRIPGENFALPASTEGFTSLEFEIATVHARLLPNDAAVVEASLSRAPIVARTQYTNTDLSLGAVLEYPIRTMNYHPDRQRFQVDTGPLIYADLGNPYEHPIERCNVAHAVFNTFDYAEFACRPSNSELQQTAPDWSAASYSEILSQTVQHTLYCES